MSSKDRIQRLRETNRRNILAVASQIIKIDGWAALSMRKIADRIDYTAPMIYSYFLDKDALICELTRTGFLALERRVNIARGESEEPAVQIEAMWMAYWKFAMEEKELYQAMFGVEITGCRSFTEIRTLAALFSNAINKLNGNEEKQNEIFSLDFYRYWSAVHGLIAIKLVHQDIPELNDFLLFKIAIQDISRAIRNGGFLPCLETRA